MFKKLLSIAAVAFVAYSASAGQTVTLWQSDEAEGVLVSWNAACAFSADEITAVVKPGDYINVTVAGVDPENGWPQIVLNKAQGGWPSYTDGVGVGNQTYPYVVTYPVDYALYDKFVADGLQISGSGAYVSEVSYTPGDVEIAPTTVWFGEKQCAWGTSVSIPASTFANVHEGDQLKFWISEASCQVILGGWSGLNLPAYAAGSIANASYVDGVYTIDMIEEYATPNEYDQNGEMKELDVFELMKANGVVMQGPTVVTRIDYIPDPWTAKSVGHATTYYANGNFAPAEDLTIKMYDGAVVIKAWAGVEGYDLKVAFDEEDNVTALTPIVKGVEGQTYTSGYASIETGAQDYYMAQFYVGTGYASAGYDDEGGYVLLSYGYFYADQTSEPVEKYYYVEWPLSAEELIESIPAEYDADVETVQGLYTTYQDIDSSFPGYAAVAGDEMSAIAKEIAGLFEEVENAMMNAAEEWGYVSPLDEEVIAALNQKLDALKAASEAAYDELLAEMADTEADITELEETFNAIKEEAESTFAGYLTLKAEEVTAIEEGLAAINEAYNAAEEEAKNVTGVWAGVPMSLMTPVTEQVMALGAEFEPTYEALLAQMDEAEEEIAEIENAYLATKNEAEEDFAGYLALKAEDVTAIEEGLAAINEAFNANQAAALAETGVWEDVPQSLLVPTTEKVMSFCSEYEPTYEALTNEMDEAEAEIVEIEESFAAIKDMAEENFPGYLVVKAEQVTAIEEGIAAINEAYNANQAAALAETGVWEDVPQELLVNVREEIMSLNAEYEPTMQAIMDAYDADVETINSQAIAMQEFPAMLEESFPGYLVLKADEISAINAQLVELSSKVEEALGEAAETGVYAGPEAEIAEVVARVDALMMGADEALMEVIIASEEDDEALWDLEATINGIPEEFEDFPAYLATTEDELDAIKDAYDELYAQYEVAMMTAMYTGVYEGINQADVMALTDAIMAYTTNGAAALAAIENASEADLDNLMQNYVAYVEDAQDNKDLSAEAKAAAQVVDDMAFDLIALVEDARETALEQTAKYVSPVTEAKIEALDAALAAYKALCPTTGINGIDAANAGVKYYDLNGTNVENPVAGKVYIRVANGNAQKVLVK